MKNRTVLFIAALVVALCLSSPFFAPVLCAQDGAPETDRILTAAESLFKAMKDKRYADIWENLTQKTQENIVESVIKAAAKNGQALTQEATSADFSAGGAVAKAYWDAYLRAFNPDMVLQQSSWKPGEIKKNEATIILQYRKAEKPAILQMRKEKGVWKTGLEETFGILRWILK